MPKVKGKARRAAAKMGNAVGISPKGIRVGKAATFGGIAAMAIIPCVADGTTRLSMLDVMMGKGGYATQTLSVRAMRAMDIAAHLLYGRVPAGAATTDYTNGKVCGYLIVGGITLTIIGKWVNKFLGGSFVKL